MSDKSMYANTLNTPVVVDSEGHILEAKGRAELPKTDEVERLLSDGSLIVAEVAKESVEDSSGDTAEETSSKSTKASTNTEGKSK